MRQQYDSDHFPETSRSSEEQMIAFGRALGSVRDHDKTTVRQPPYKKLFISLSMRPPVPLTAVPGCRFPTLPSKAIQSRTKAGRARSTCKQEQNSSRKPHSHSHVQSISKSQNVLVPGYHLPKRPSDSALYQRRTCSLTRPRPLTKTTLASSTHFKITKRSLTHARNP